MSFLNPYLLIALAGIGVPILIHLLTRDRVQHVAYSTLRFFAKVSRSVLRRKRFREMILLAMRAAVCGLVALAFARPILRAKEDGEGLHAATARVLVVDASASMTRAGLPAAALKEAERVLATLSEGADAAALIAFSDSPRVEAPLSQNFSEVRARLKALVPGHGGTDIDEALHKADTLLRGATARRKEIVLISDLQRVGWRSFKGDWKLAPDTRLSVRPVVPAGSPANTAIIEADYPASTALDGQPRAISVRVANFSAEDRRDLEVTLTIAGKKIDSQKIHIRPGESAPVRFRHVFTASGSNLGAVTVGSADAVAEDNVYYFNARVIPRIPVTIISGRAAAVAASDGAARAGAQDAAFFIEKALAPGPDSPFGVKRAAAAQAAPDDVADALVVVLADVRELPSPMIQALKDLLARGGGILFLPGDQVQPDVFARVFGDIAPCKLKGVLRPAAAAGEAPGATLAQVDFEHPVFEVFQHPHFGDLSLPRFRQFWEVTDSQLAQVLARFSDGRPAVLEREMGGGVSMLMAGPMDLRWNNFPLRAVFLPYMHQTVRYLAVRSEKRTGYQVGDTLPVPAGCTLTDPQGKVLTLEGGAVAAAMPGFYVAAGKGAAETFQFAVNRDLAEADPATLAAEELAGAVQEPEGAIAEARAGSEAAGADRAKDDHGFWWYITLAATILVVAELYVANKTLRH